MIPITLISAGLWKAPAKPTPARQKNAAARTRNSGNRELRGHDTHSNTSSRLARTWLAPGLAGLQASPEPHFGRRSERQRSRRAASGASGLKTFERRTFERRTFERRTFERLSAGWRQVQQAGKGARALQRRRDADQRVNAETRQDASTADMIFSFARLIAYRSSFATLLPGDVILTGTPTGAGARFTPSNWLKPGGVAEVAASGLGALGNSLRDEAV